MKPQVLIIFPKKDTTDASHYPYWYRVFDEASSQLDIQYIYESSHSKLSRIFLMFNFAIQGYTNIYIHYSYWSVFIARFISLFIPLKIFYWDCEWYDKKPKNALLQLALRWCDVLVTGSPSIANQYIKIFKLRTTHHVPRTAIVPNWSEYTKVESLQLNKDQIHILFVHHLSPRKGSLELPEIIRQTLIKVPNTHFHIIGDGPDLTILRSSDLANTTFYGSLPLPEVRRFFASCDYFIMPSRSEGFPRVILEAMNYGLPIVATNVGNVQELVGETQKNYLTDPENTTTFANKLVSLINSSSQTKASIIKENIQKAKEYSLNNSVDKFIQLFGTTETNI